MRDLRAIRACVFDAYGTIFDVTSSLINCENVPIEQRAELTSLWRDMQIHYTWLRTIQGCYADFWQVTANALDYALETLGIATPKLHAQLMQRWLNLSIFPEAPQALNWLHRAGYTTAILSNGSPKMLEAAINNARLGALIDEIVSADEVRVFKTHARVYERCLDRLNLEPRQILYHSSNAWDAFAASDFGFQVVWCNRKDEKRERMPGAPDFEVTNLSELPALFARGAASSSRRW